MRCLSTHNARLRPISRINELGEASASTGETACATHCGVDGDGTFRNWIWGEAKLISRSNLLEWVLGGLLVNGRLNGLEDRSRTQSSSAARDGVVVRQCTARLQRMQGDSWFSAGMCKAFHWKFARSRGKWTLNANQPLESPHFNRPQHCSGQETILSWNNNIVGRDPLPLERLEKGDASFYAGRAIPRFQNAELRYSSRAHGTRRIVSTTKNPLRVGSCVSASSDEHCFCYLGSYLLAVYKSALTLAAVVSSVRVLQPTTSF